MGKAQPNAQCNGENVWNQLGEKIIGWIDNMHLYLVSHKISNVPTVN